MNFSELVGKLFDTMPTLGELNPMEFLVYFAVSGAIAAVLFGTFFGSIFFGVLECISNLVTTKDRMQKIAMRAVWFINSMRGFVVTEDMVMTNFNIRPKMYIKYIKPIVEPVILHHNKEVADNE